MKNFFNTASTDTIGECLSGEKLLNASRDAKGNTLLTFESSYPLVAAVELDGFVDCCPRCHTSVGYRWLEEIQPAFLQLADIDQRMNSDKEGQPLPPEKQGWKIEIRQG